MMAKTGFVKKLFIRLAILTPFVILPLYAIKVHLYTGYCDFEVYYKTALRLKAGAWNEVYNLAIDGSNPFRYTPPTLLFFRPLAELPYSFARVLFFLLNFTAYVLGFAYLARTLRLLRADVPLILSATLFLTLRYFLDSFTIGQVSGLMFLGFAMAQFYFVSGQHALAGRALVLPATLKLTPVLFFGLFQWRSARSSVLLGSLLIAISIIYTGGIDRFHYLIQTFSTTLTGDDSYFDSSHYGSQSLKSALLRFDQAFELIRLSHVKEVWIGALVLGTLGLLLSWNTKKPKSLEAKALSFNLGIFAYLLFMPQTFKYSMPFLAFPIAILLANKSTSLFIRPHRMKAVFWGFCFLVFGFGGKDVVGDYLFFGAQKASLPFFCMLGLWIATLREYRRSHISHLEASTPSAFSQEPLKNGTLDLSVIIVGTEEEIQRLAVYRRAFADAEIIELATTEERTRGMVLREAFVRSHGKNLVFMNPNQIVIDNFFERALSELKLGSSLVRSNRRLRESRFRVPGNLIRVAYRRHRLSVFANSLIQKFLKTS